MSFKHLPLVTAVYRYKLCFTCLCTLVTRRTLIIHCLLTRQSNVPVCARMDWTGLEKGFSTYLYFQLSGGYRSGDNLLLHYICLCCSPGYLSQKNIQIILLLLNRKNYVRYRYNNCKSRPVCHQHNT
jgi:hypothetical protein